MPICQKCGGLTLVSIDHKCVPKWKVRIPEWSGQDRWDTVHAADTEEAATKYFESQNDDYYEGEIDVEVINAEGRIERWCCGTAVELTYFGTLVEEYDDDDKARDEE